MSAPIRQIAVAQQEAQPAVVKIILVVALDGIGDKRDAHFVVEPMPAMAGIIAAEKIVSPTSV